MPKPIKKKSVKKKVAKKRGDLPPVGTPPDPRSLGKKTVRKSKKPTGRKSSLTEKISSRVSRDRRVRRVVRRYAPLDEIETFLSKYVVLSRMEILVVSTWILASWLASLWDRFPHLAITSPEKRCGKTLLLHLIELVTRSAYNTTNISPAAVYRLIESRQPTLILDEAQSISRRGSETSEILRELLNAGIDRNAKVLRVGGKDRNEIQEFHVYSPKVIALIGKLDNVLADRCLPVSMKRKTKADTVQHYRSRVVGPIGAKLLKEIEQWAKKHGKRIAKIYDTLDTFDMENDRLAELLLPLQAVLVVVDKDRLVELEQYAKVLDKADQTTETPGVRILTACREIFNNAKTTGEKNFIPTTKLIMKLTSRAEEPWLRWNRGEPITAETLANLLRPYGIHSSRDKGQKYRGFFAYDFEESWNRYLPPIPSKNPPSPTSPTSPTSKILRKRKAK
jgi:hypothetical protein